MIRGRVKVLKVPQEKVMNLWGGYDDVTGLIGQTGTITRIISPDTEYEQYGIEFDDDFAHLTRQRTGIIFSEEHLETVK
jgi:hypothetical protein